MSDELFDDVEIALTAEEQAELDALIAPFEQKKVFDNKYAVKWGKLGRYYVKLVIPEGYNREKWSTHFTTPYTKAGKTTDTVNAMIDVIFIKALPDKSLSAKEKEQVEALANNKLVYHARVSGSFFKEIAVAVIKAKKQPLDNNGNVLDVEITLGSNGFPQYRVTPLISPKTGKYNFYDDREAEFPPTTIDEAVTDFVDFAENYGKEKDALPFVKSAPNADN